MPRVGFTCEVNGECVTDAICLNCALNRLLRLDPLTQIRRHCQYPYPYIAACHADQEGREHAGISSTMLASNCLRKTVWEARKDYHRYPHQLQPSVKGTAQHAYFERFNETGIIAEQRLVKRLPDGRMVSGQVDRYLARFNRIEDYKLKSEEHEPFGVAPLGYVAQLNIYRYFLMTGCVILETGEVIPPQSEITELVLYPSNHKDWNEVYCPLWPLDVVEQLIEEVLSILEKGIENGMIEDDTEDSYIPPRGFEKPETHPFCRGYCPFWQECCATGGEYRDILLETVETIRETART